MTRQEQQQQAEEPNATNSHETPDVKADVVKSAALFPHKKKQSNQKNTSVSPQMTKFVPRIVSSDGLPHDEMQLHQETTTGRCIATSTMSSLLHQQRRQLTPLLLSPSNHNAVWDNQSNTEWPENNNNNNNNNTLLLSPSNDNKEWDHQTNMEWPVNYYNNNTIRMPPLQATHWPDPIPLDDYEEGWGDFHDVGEMGVDDAEIIIHMLSAENRTMC